MDIFNNREYFIHTYIYIMLTDSRSRLIDTRNRNRTDTSDRLINRLSDTSIDRRKIFEIICKLYVYFIEQFVDCGQINNIKNIIVCAKCVLLQNDAVLCSSAWLIARGCCCVLIYIRTHALTSLQSKRRSSRQV